MQSDIIKNPMLICNCKHTYKHIYKHTYTYGMHAYIATYITYSGNVYSLHVGIMKTNYEVITIYS